MESLQHVLDRVRKPRVHITYDVEIGGAIQMKELPFVMGIMSDLAGHRSSELPKLKDRKFVEINPDNFNEILSSIAPVMSLTVPNRMPQAANDATMNVKLAFKTMDDFSPLNIAKQIDVLSNLYKTRINLTDLLAKLDGNDELHTIFKDLMQHPEKVNELRKNLTAAISAERTSQ